MAHSAKIQYFLGANSPSGFYSLYHELLPPQQARAIYLIKGGPGCGKSTLMRHVAHLAQQAGEPVEYILCSGDPDSLDAVLLPRLQVALADATAPHVLEPAFPGAVERYVDLSGNYDRAALGRLREEVIAATNRYKACYPRAYRCLKACSLLMEDARSMLMTPAVSEKLARRARGILKRELKRRDDLPSPAVRQRFLNAVTCQGPLYLTDTALAQCQEVYLLRDSFGLAHGMLSHLLAGALERGYSPIACPDPMCPQRLAHLLLPQAGLAFLSAPAALPLPFSPSRQLHLDAVPGAAALRPARARLRFTRRMSQELLAESIQDLARAKSFHDQLEDLYHPYVDFSALPALAQTIADEFL